MDVCVEKVRAHVHEQALAALTDLGQELTGAVTEDFCGLRVSKHVEAIRNAPGGCYQGAKRGDVVDSPLHHPHKMRLYKRRVPRRK